MTKEKPNLQPKHKKMQPKHTQKCNQIKTKINKHEQNTTKTKPKQRAAQKKHFKELL